MNGAESGVRNNDRNQEEEKETQFIMEDDPEFEELKKSLFQEVKFVHLEMQKFEDLFRP
jgi:hypothetical protein